jgi:hypothetical protein
MTAVGFDAGGHCGPEHGVGLKARGAMLVVADIHELAAAIAKLLRVTTRRQPNLLAGADSPAEKEGCERWSHAKDYARGAEPLFRQPQDHMNSSLDLKGFVRGLDQPMSTFRLPAE